jgi:hypothetical protein
VHIESYVNCSLAMSTAVISNSISPSRADHVNGYAAAQDHDPIAGVKSDKVVGATAHTGHAHVQKHITPGGHPMDFR